MNGKRHGWICVAVLSACGDGATAAGPDGSSPPDNAALAADGLDLDAASAIDTPRAQFDGGADGAGTDSVGGASDAASAADGSPSDALTSPCNFETPGPGACGSPCAKDNECLAGFCVPTRSDRVCTMNCAAGPCPQGWACKQLSAAPDTIYGCVPESPNLGRPCQSDLDCVTAVGQTVVGLTDVCVPRGTEGAFCGADCGGGKVVCPKGFACQTVVSLGGKAAKQCVADVLDDNCTARFEQEKAEAVCTRKNDAGACLGKRRCEGKKLAVCDAKEPKPEVCNAADDDCDGQFNEPVAGATCKVQGPEGACVGKPMCDGGVETCVGPKPAAEACNGADDDCDGQTDEGCDDDKDGWCDSLMGYDPAGGKPACAKGAGDCADFDAGVHPGQKETCNGADDNCNGKKDADDPQLTLDDVQKCDLQTGPCAGAKKSAELCQGGKWLACTDLDYQKYFAAFAKNEVCDDKDNDCSGVADDGCDDDKDGFCDSKLATVGFPLSCPKGGGDCNDGLKDAKPGAAEACDDLDQNCDGSTDEGCDKDKDGWCDKDLNVSGKPKACPAGGGDCDDLDKKKLPGAPEACNFVDDNCNGQTDEAFADLGKPCAGGAGACAAAGTTVCAPDGKSALCSVSPPEPGVEACNGLDDDCDSKTDEGCDDDKDGFCDSALAVFGKPKVCPGGAGDCDDTDPDSKPGLPELCNGKDDDCDGKVDAKDGDLAFDDPQPCEKQAGTCKGAKKAPDLCQGGKWLGCGAIDYAAWHPYWQPAELCDNLDNDCNGKADEGCDEDSDDWCNAKMIMVGNVKTCPKGAGDCNDDSAAVSPFHEEYCDGKDNDCNNKPDDGCDKDQDSYCDIGKTVIGLPAVCVNGGDDCDDKDGKVNPGQKEVCADFLDQNCSGTADEGCAPTTLDFSGKLGPDMALEGFLQCAGYFDQPGGDDVPLAFGSACLDPKWQKLRIACGPSPDKVRWIAVKKNVFGSGLAAGAEEGLIVDSNFDLGGNNLIKADAPGNPNAARSWWVSPLGGCSESFAALSVNNGSCGWEAANCFGYGLMGSRYLFVYVGK